MFILSGNLFSAVFMFLYFPFLSPHNFLVFFSSALNETVCAGYRLVVDSAGDPEVRSWCTQFHFDTDQKRLDSIREVNSRLKPLEKKMERFNLDLNVSCRQFPW